MQPLFTWAHLSDIHVGHGDPSVEWDQQLVLETLKEDIRNPSAEYEIPIPMPNAIFVTGDLAYSGDTQNRNEYQRVSNWLIEVGESVSIGEDSIFLVPGNHDVQRTIEEEDNSVKRLLEFLRSGREKLDIVLAHDEDRELLVKRMQNYFNFAKDFAPNNDLNLFWIYSLIVQGLTIRIAGFNTALLSADDNDKGNLELGKAQLARAFNPMPNKSNEIVIVLSHHPFKWMRDGRDASSYTKNRAHIHLFGHIHEAEVEHLRSGGGQQLVQIVSGAAHGESPHNNIPTGHGFNFGAIMARDDDQIVLRVWPRIWSQRNTDFRIDIDNVPRGKQFSEFELRMKLSRIPSEEDRGLRSKGIPKEKMVLIYAEKNRSFIEKSTFIDFLESLAEEEALDFSWDRKKLGNAEMKKRLDEADIVICLVSQPFLISNYRKAVESKIEASQKKKQEIIVVPIMLEACSWEKYKWISQDKRLPEDNGYIIPHHNGDRAETFKKIIDHLRIHIRNRRQAVASAEPAEAFQKPDALYTIRRLPDTSFAEEEKKLLIADSMSRAIKFVPDEKLRQKICNQAKKVIKKNEGEPLNKRQLEELDEDFLVLLSITEESLEILNAKGVPESILKKLLGLINQEYKGRKKLLSILKATIGSEQTFKFKSLILRQIQRSRKPDAEIVRWVLRAARLHPQGRVVR